jgi:hypothetical protein
MGELVLRAVDCVAVAVAVETIAYRQARLVQMASYFCWTRAPTRRFYFDAQGLGLTRSTELLAE